jgi:hypothetical protein
LLKYLGDADEIRLSRVFEMFQAKLLEMVRSMSRFYRMVKAQCKVVAPSSLGRKHSIWLSFCCKNIWVVHMRLGKIAISRHSAQCRWNWCVRCNRFQER